MREDRDVVQQSGRGAVGMKPILVKQPGPPRR
jgi:hypothetical protein